MIYKLEVRFTNGEIYTYAMELRGISDMAIALENADNVSQIRVEGLDQLEDFGLGGITKWVKKFTWE